MIVKNTVVFCHKISEMCNVASKYATLRVCQDGGGGYFKSVVSVMNTKVNPDTETKGEMLSGVN